MKSTVSMATFARSVVLFLCVLFLALSLNTRAVPVVASSAQNGQIHITKDCSAYTGAAGGYCTIVTSNLAQIPKGATVNYDQAFGVPSGMLDSNVVVGVGTGNWAVGRCTLDGSTGAGICTFSDGTGPLAGFTGRVDVSYLGGTLYGWDGTYSFNALPPR